MSLKTLLCLFEWGCVWGVGGVFFVYLFYYPDSHEHSIKGGLYNSFLVGKTINTQTERSLMVDFKLN